MIYLTELFKSFWKKKPKSKQNFFSNYDFKDLKHIQLASPSLKLSGMKKLCICWEQRQFFFISIKSLKIKTFESKPKYFINVREKIVVYIHKLWKCSLKTKDNKQIVPTINGFQESQLLLHSQFLSGCLLQEGTEFPSF